MNQIKLFLLIILSAIIVLLSAQDNTLYHMPVIPQSNQLNPAYIHKCRVYIELPVISSVRLNIRNTGFGFHDAVHTTEGVQSDTFFLDLDNLEKKMWRRNYFLTETDVDLLGFGFPVKDWYITFGLINHTSLRITYPDDIISVKDGNWDLNTGNPIPLSFDGLGFDFTAWNSIGVSAAKELYQGLTVGVRLKYLQGMANFNTRRSNLELSTAGNPISLEAEASYKINAAFPVTLGYNTLGLVNSVNISNAFNNITGDFIFNKNRGVAIDAGMVYDIDDETQVTASFTDLGFIHWKKNVNNFDARGKYTFSGIDIDSIQANSGQVDLLQALQDSLFRAFTAEGTTKGYFTSSPVRIYGGITRILMSKLKAGAITRIEFYDLNIRPSLTLSLNYLPKPWLATTMSYTLMNHKLNQVGAGLALGNRGVQFYVLTDNIPVRFTNLSGSPLSWPYNARMLSLRFGFNILFGCNEKDSKGRPQRSRGKETCPAYW